MKRILTVLLILLPFIAPQIQGAMLVGEEQCQSVSVAYSDQAVDVEMADCGEMESHCEQSCTNQVRLPISLFLPSWPSVQRVYMPARQSIAVMPGFAVLLEHPPQI